MVFYLNECSLVGQYDNLEEFLNYDLADVVRCINLIRKNGNIVLVKLSDFYKAKVTKANSISDLMNMPISDEMARVRMLLANEIYDGPYWDDDEFKELSDAKYLYNNEDVTLTSVAEAAERNAYLISFGRKEYIDLVINVLRIKQQDTTEMNVISVHSERYFINQFGDKLSINRDDQLKIMYRGTRIDLSLLESKYGTVILEDSEFDSLKSTFDKFIKHESFDTISLDDGLQYKKYSPEQKGKNRFSSVKYKDKTIMKFRFSSKNRVYGYRKGEKFFVLRLENDHSVSDYG